MAIELDAFVERERAAARARYHLRTEMQRQLRLETRLKEKEEERLQKLAQRGVSPLHETMDLFRGASDPW